MAKQKKPEQKKKKKKQKARRKPYMIAMDGQIYEPDSIVLLNQEIDEKMKVELVESIALQVAFLEALKAIMPYWHQRPGIHPNIKNMTKKFEKEDIGRLIALHNTLEFYANQKFPITPSRPVKEMAQEALLKMFEEVEQMPDAWTDDGKLKKEYSKELQEGLKKALFDDKTNVLDKDLGL